jgi:hypothetical protein
MKKCALAAIVAAMTVAVAPGAPAQAMEHQAAIDHAAGPIAADYAGRTQVAMKQVGSAGAAGRPSSLSCRWTVSLAVERHARLSSGHEARRSLVRSDVVKGSSPGWCPDRENGGERIVARHKADIHAAMMALVEQDRAMILADADRLHEASRGG